MFITRIFSFASNGLAKLHRVCILVWVGFVEHPFVIPFEISRVMYVPLGCSSVDMQAAHVQSFFQRCIFRRDFSVTWNS